MQGDWKVETLRLTYFVGAAWILRPLYSTVLGVNPDQIVSNPNALAQSETGMAFGAFMSINQQPGRVDFVLSDAPPNNVMLIPNKPFFWAGEYSRLVHEFDRIVEISSSLMIDCTRVAYAIAVIQPTNTMIDAMGILKGKVSQLSLNPSTEGDLIFQIGRTIDDQTIGKVNLLSRWDALRTQTLSMIAGGLGAISTSQTQAYAARIYLDVSTDQERLQPIGDIDLIYSLNLLKRIALTGIGEEA